MARWGQYGGVVKLSDSSYAVLVVIALRGPSTGYEVKRALTRLAGEFWATPHTQVYRECARLVEDGMLDAEEEDSGRRRRVFTLTPTGRDTVTTWVREPTDASMQIHDVALLKLSAIELSTPDAIRTLAQQQMAAYQQRLATLDDIEARLATRPAAALRIRNLAVGRGVYNAQLSFWTHLAAEPLPPTDGQSGPQPETGTDRAATATA
jgi:DNA-binding PadR family transcriptional regulator